jgi:superfamily II DNA/RNA helicase
MTAPSRADLADLYLAQIPYTPYAIQEEALLAWFTADQGVLVCTPTGTGKTLIAQAALFEALHSGTMAYYTTPLIALTEQKFQEMQACAVRWGYKLEDIGLVTGNRRINPNARILVVVAEILLNRLLHTEAFDFNRVSAVVMDEFHSFANPERGIVWELSLGLLPNSIRLLLLSATVGNASEFVTWLERHQCRKLDLVQGKERRVPLTYHWVPDLFLNEQLVEMARGEQAARKTPALVFCFNREECWSVAEQLKGLPLLGPEQKTRLHAEVNKLEWTQGIGPKIRQMLHRGVGVHHAGMLPKYRRVVEDLFEKKLLAVVICTETLAAGINLPARSVVLSRLVKGPHGKERLVDASTAHQIFGRAGRPQYDDRGYIFAVAPEDDVKILRWREKYDAIPETTKDPLLLKAKKALKRKKPSRREGVRYWSESDFKQLQAAPPGKLYSKGPIPWRLLAYMLKLSPEVARVRILIRKRLMDDSRILAAEKILEQMLLVLADGKFVTLEFEQRAKSETEVSEARQQLEQGSEARKESPPRVLLAHATPKLDQLLVFRSIHPLYGAFLSEQLGIANSDELIQALESVLEMPRPLLRYVRVPFDLPPGPLATTRLDAELVRRGLISAPVGSEGAEEEEDDDDFENSERPPMLADKLRLLFDATYASVSDVSTQSIWCAGELLRFNGNFNLFVKTRDLVKQEGIVFRHLLRLILLCGEFAQVCPPEIEPGRWQETLSELAQRLTASCREADPASTDEIMEQARAADVVEGEAPVKA